MKERPHLDQEIIRLMNQTKGYKITPPGVSTMDIRTGAVLIGGVRTLFEPRFLLDGKIQMILPKEFQSLPPEKVYQPEARPDVLLIEAGGAMQITIAHPAKPVANDREVSAYKEEVKRVLTAMNASIEWLPDGVREVGGKPAFFFESVTPLMSAKVYNLSFFMPLDGRVLTGSFIGDERRRKAWRPFLIQMIDSIVPQTGAGANRVNVNEKG